MEGVGEGVGEVEEVVVVVVVVVVGWVLSGGCGVGFIKRGFYTLEED